MVIKMKFELLVVIIFTLIASIASMLMLQYEMRLLEQGGERSKKITIFPVSKKIKIYGLLMIIVQTALVIAVWNIYDYMTICMLVKRIGLLALIWQAAVTDWKYHKIPNDIILTGVAFWLLMLLVEFIFEREWVLINLISEGIALAGMLVLIILCLILMKNSIGMGDLKLIMIMSACQGLEGIMSSMFFSLVVAFIIAIVLLITKKKTRKDVLPFAPCLLAGTILGVFLTGM